MIVGMTRNLTVNQKVVGKLNLYLDMQDGTDEPLAIVGLSVDGWKVGNTKLAMSQLSIRDPLELEGITTGPPVLDEMPRYVDSLLGLTEGPRWNNFGVCSPGDWVCTFECIDHFGPEKKLTLWLCDLYVVTRGVQQSYVLRMDEDWEGSYHSGPIETLFTIPHKPWSQALYALCSLGHFAWAQK